MGIEGYLSWLKSVIPTAFSPGFSQPRFDRVYVDLNGFLHRSAYRSLTESHVLSDCHRSLRYLLQRLRPREEFYIAADGAASTLKMRLQRERRSEMGEELSRRDKSAFSSLKFTPGTMFMGQMEDYLVSKLVRNIYNLKITLDGASHKGEGELKVIQQAALQKSSGSVCIISFDSDAIIHALYSGIKNISVFNPQAEIFFDAQKAKLLLREEYGITEELLPFFCLLSNFMGNDITSRFRYGSIKILFPLLQILLKANKLNPSDGPYGMMRTLADAYLKSLVNSELQFYQRNERSYELAEPDLEERLANHWFLNQWLLESITDSSVQVDLDLVPGKVGPILGDVLKVDPAKLSEQLNVLEKQHLHDSEKIPKLPGAVALVLFEPESPAITHLPLPLQKLADDLDPVAWSEGNCLKLLGEYSQRIQAIPRSDFTPEELRVTFDAEPNVYLQKSHPPVPFIRNSQLV